MGSFPTIRSLAEGGWLVKGFKHNSEVMSTGGTHLSVVHKVLLTVHPKNTGVWRCYPAVHHYHVTLDVDRHAFVIVCTRTTWPRKRKKQIGLLYRCALYYSVDCCLFYTIYIAVQITISAMIDSWYSVTKVQFPLCTGEWILCTRCIDVHIR